jgi:hypothetical protein
VTKKLEAANVRAFLSLRQSPNEPMPVWKIGVVFEQLERPLRSHAGYRGRDSHGAQVIGDENNSAVVQIRGCYNFRSAQDRRKAFSLVQSELVKMAVPNAVPPDVRQRGDTLDIRLKQSGSLQATIAVTL